METFYKRFTMRNLVKASPSLFLFFAMMLSFNVSGQGFATISAITPQPICSGSTASVGVYMAPTTPGTYSWTITLLLPDASTFTVSTTDNPYWIANGATFTQTSTYTLVSVIQNNGGATYTLTATTATVTVVPLTTATASNNGPVCVGTTLTLTGGPDGMSTYSWTGPDSFTSTQQSPTVSSSATMAMAGTYYLTVFDGTCTSTTVTTTVTVNALPVATASNNGPVCTGATLTLTGGPGAMSSYSWTGPNSFTSAEQSPTVSASATTTMAGIYSLTVFNGTCTSTTVTTTVTVNVTPVATATNNGPVCEGTTLTLTGGPGGMSTYSWTGPGTYTSNLMSPTVSAAATTAMAGTYTLTVFSGSCTDTETTTVVVNPLPVATAGNNGPVCTGNPLSLTGSATGSGTMQYSWTGPDSFTSTVQNPTVSASATTAMAGTYSLTVFNGTCTATTVTTTVTVNVTPTGTAANNGPVCVGATLSLTGTATGPGTLAYSWTGPSSFTSTALSPTVSTSATTAMSGTYTLVITNGTCTSTSLTTTATVVAQTNINTQPVNATTCAGGTVSYTITVDPAAPAPAYLWYEQSVPFGAYNALTDGGVYSGVTTATLTLTGVPVSMNGYRYECHVTGCGILKISDNAGLTVNANPVATAGYNSPACVGSPLILAGGPGSMTTYSWTGPNGFTSSEQNPTVNASATTAMSGTYTLTVVDANGCSSSAVGTSVTVNPLPVGSASNNGPVCEEDPLILTGSGGTTYSWTGPDGFTSNVASPTVSSSATSAMAGTYYLTVSDGTCTGTTVSTTVTVNPKPTASASSNSAVCVGQTLNLYGTGAGTGTLIYTWSGPNTFSSTLQNPVIASVTTAAAGTYTLVVTNGTCTSTAATTPVVINTLPVASAGSNSPVCTGNPLTLTGSASGGSGSGYLYSWTGPDGFASTEQSPTVSASATTAMAGSYILTVTDGNTCTSTVATATVVVNVTPVATATNNGPVCIGDPLILTGGPGGMSTYSWTGPNSFTSTEQSPTVSTSATTAMSGVYTLTVFSGSCTDTETTTAVVVDQTEILSNPVNTTICEGETATFAIEVDPTAPAPTILWFQQVLPDVTYYPLTNTPPFSGVDTKTLTITATPLSMNGRRYEAHVFGCGDPRISNNALLTVNENPVPVAGYNAPSCIGQPLIMAGSATGGTGTYTWSWAGPNSFSSTQQNPTVTASATSAEAGTYTLTVNDGNCSASTTTVVVVNSLPVATTSSNTPVCENGTINLTGGPGSGVTYSWTGPLGFTSTSQNPSIPSATTAMGGVYSLTVYDGTCYSLPSTTMVVVNPLPIATPGSNTPVCVGSALTLSGSGSGTGILSYSWTGPNSYTSTEQNPTVTSAATTADAGTYTLTVTDANCTSLPVGTVVVVNPLPAVSANSNTDVCVGQWLQLYSLPNGMTSYSWVGPNGFTSTMQDPYINPASTANAGTYTVTVVDGNGCTASAATTVVINTLPVAVPSSDSPKCVGQTLTLTGAATGGSGSYSYAWSGPNSFTSAAQNPTIPSVTLAAAGDYTLIVTDGNGCSSLPVATTVVINPLPVVTATSNSPVCTGGTLNLTATGGTATITTSYSWTGPQSFAQTTLWPTLIATHGSVTTLNSGIYTLTVTDGLTGCVNTATVSVTVTDPVGTPTTPVGTNSRCIGTGTDDYTATAANAVTYTWTLTPPEAGSISGTGTTGTVIWNPAFTSTATVGVTGTNVCGTSVQSTLNVIVHALPTATAANSGPVCVGFTLSLTGTASGDGTLTYSWTGPNGFTSTELSPTVTTAATTANAGTYTLTVTDNYCTSLPATTTVVVNVLPVATADDNSPVCVGQTLSLTGGPTGMVTYSWTGPAGFTSNLQSPTVSTSATTAMGGIYTLIVTDVNCTSLPATTTVVVNPLPVATATNNALTGICSGTTLTLTGGPDFMSSYNWTGPNGYTSTEQSPTVSTSATTAMGGTYYLIVNNGTCSSIAASTTAIVYPLPDASITSNSPVCVGNTLNLTAAGGAAVPATRYDFTGPAGFLHTNYWPVVLATYTPVSLANMGWYVLTVTDGITGCINKDSVYVTITDPAGVPVITSGILSRCVGVGADIYTATSANAVTFNWTITPTAAGTITTGSSSATVTWDPLWVGVATIGVTGTNVCGTSAQTTTDVTTHALPTATAANNGPVCVGTTLSLTGTASGTAPFTYNWTGPNGFNSTMLSPTVSTSATTAMAGTYTLVVTDAYCTSLPATTVAVVNPLPVATASSNSPVCVGQALMLTGGPNGMASYSWTGPAGFTSNLQSPTVSTSATTAMAGAYILTVIDGNGCTSLPVSTTVVVNTLPTATAANNGPICAEETLTLTGTVTAGSGGSGPWTYSWTGPNGFTSSLLSPTVSTSATTAMGGVYSLIVNDGSCTSLPVTTTAVVYPLPDVDITSDEPICTGGALHLTGSGGTTGTTTTGTKYEWWGPAGYVETTYYPTEMVSLSLVTTLNTGWYYLRITNDPTGCIDYDSTWVTVTEPVGTPTTPSGPTSRCEGVGSSVYTATAANATSYTWTITPPEAGTIAGTSTTGTVTWSPSWVGVATIGVTGTNVCGTSAQTTVGVTTHALPLATASNNGPVCVGTTLSLTGNASGTAPFSYSWTGPNGFTSTVQSPVVSTSATTAMAGTYTLTVMDAYCTSLPVTTVAVVNALPVAIPESNTPVCVGQPLMLMGGPDGMVSYSWIGPNGFTSTQQNPTVSATATTAMAGNYTLQVFDGSCYSLAVSTPVVINTLPVATAANNGPVCTNETLTLTGTVTNVGTPGTGPWSYYWTGPNGFTSTQLSPTVSTAATTAMSGTYTLMVNNGTCSSTAATTDATVYPLPDAVATSNSPICTGGILHLTAGGGAPSGLTTYAWTGPAGFSQTTTWPTIVATHNSVTTANTGWYYLTVTDGITGCVDTASVYVTVYNPVGTPSTPSGPLTRCEGAGTSTYTTSAANATSYNWSITPGAGTITTGSSSAVVTWDAAFYGVATISVTATNVCGTSAPATLDVTVYALPIATAVNNGPVCVNGTLMLAGGPNFMSSYSWTGPNGFTSSLQNPTVSTAATLAMAGDYTLIVADENCTSLPVATTVVVNALPVATADNNGPVCEMQMLTLTGGPDGMASYLWSGPNGFTSNLQSPTVSSSATTAMAGTYSLIVNDGNCNSLAATTLVEVYVLPVATAANNGPVCAEETLSLMGGPDGMVSYSWTGPDGFTSALQNPVVSTSATTAMSGVYTLVVSDGNCNSLPVTTTAIVHPLPVVDLTSNSPICTGTTLHLTGSGGAAITATKYEWSGPAGYSETTYWPSVQVSVTSVTTLNTGWYYLVVTDGVTGCVNIDSTWVDVQDPVGTPSTPSGTLTRCQGPGTDTYTTSAANATSYNWTITPAAGTITTGTASAVVTWNASFYGVATISVTATNECGTSAPATLGVTVYMLPVPTAGNNGPVCVGTTLALSGSTTGTAPFSYTWVGPNGFSSTEQNPVVTSSATLANAGTYTLIVTDAHCTSQPVETVVVVNALPVATAENNGPVCVGELLTLTGGPDGMISYAWSGPNGFTSTDQSPIVSSSATLAMAGTYSLQVFDGNCNSLAAYTTVVVNALPIATADNNGPVCAGETLTLAGGPDGMASYTWSGPNGFTSNLQNPTVSTAATTAMGGVYTLVVNDGNCNSLPVSTTAIVHPLPVVVATSNSPICTGGILYLTASGGAPVGTTQYLWTGPAGFTQTTYYPTVIASHNSVTTANTGWYYLTVTDGITGCVNIDSTWVDVMNPVGTPSTPSGTTARCQGEGTDTYTTSAANAVTYNWTITPGAGTITTGTASAVVTWNASFFGTATISVTGENVCGISVSATLDVTVYELPTAIALDNSPVCVGGTLILTGSASGGTAPYSYAWSGPNGFTSTEQSPTVSTSATMDMAGIYTLIVTDEHCTSLPATTAVVVNALPIATASNNGPVCVGELLTLAGGPEGMSSYSWTGPNGFTSNLQSPTVSASATTAMAGVYTLIVNDGNCTSLPATTTVVVNPLPVATASNNGPVCAEDLLTLTGGPDGMTSYSWTGPGGFTSALQSPTVSTSATVAMAGVYTLIVTDANCTSLPVTTTVVVHPLPVVDITSNSPICTGTTLHLTGSGGAAIVATRYDWSGPAGYSETTYWPSVQVSVTSVTTLNTGWYYLTVTDGITGCQNTDSTYVTVTDPVGTPSTPNGTSERCQGEGTDTYSTFALNAVTYNWTITPASAGTITTGTETAIVTWNASFSGIATISVTGTNVCGTSAPATLDVTVWALPGASASSNSPVCVGSILNLTGLATGTAPFTYAWTGPNGFSSTELSPTVSTSATSAMAGIYTLIVTDAHCTSMPAETVVVVNPLPVATASNNGPVCEMEILTLTGGPDGMASYTWTGPNGFSSNLQSPTVSASATTAMAGVYTLVVNDGNCDSDPVTTTVEVNVLPIAIAGNNGPVCIDQPLVLVGGPAGMASYSWTGPGGYTSNLQNPTVSSAATLEMAGVYTLIVNDGDCSSLPVTTMVVVMPLPVVDASSNSPVCSGGTLNLTASGGAAVPATTYQWTGPLGFAQTTNWPTVVAQHSTVTTANTGWYYLTVTDGITGCQNFDSTYVIVTDPAGTPTTPDGTTERCEGAGTDTYTTSAANAVTYNWTITPAGAGTITTGTASAVVTWNATFSGIATISVTATNVCGTSAAATLDVTVHALPVATAANNGPVCVGTTLSLIGGPTGMVSYSWTGPNGFSSTEQSPTVTTSATLADAGVYTLIVTDVNCTSLPAATTVVVNALPVATASNNGPVCVGEMLTLPGGPDGMVSYSWTGPNGFVSNEQNPIVSASATMAMAGVYTLIVNDGNCNSLPVTTTVVVNTLPVATAGNTGPVCVGETIALMGGPAGMTSYSWTGPNGYTSALQNPTISTSATTAMGGVYTLIVTDENCSSLPVTTTVVIYPLPVVSATSNSPVCTGGTLNLTASGGAPVPATQYTWTGPGGFTQTTYWPTMVATHSAVTSANAGTYVLTVTDGVTGCQNTASTVVVVSPTTVGGTVAADQTICAGVTPASIGVTGNVGAVVQWESANDPAFTTPVIIPVTTTTLPGATIGPLFTTTYFRVLIQSAGCNAVYSSNYVTITVNPIPPTPIVGVVNNCGNSVLTVTNPATGATFLWSNGATTASITVTSAGVYGVTQTVNGCTSPLGFGTAAPNAIPAAPTVTVVNSCGSSLLTASGVAGATFLWSTGETTASITVTTAGTYTVYQTTPAGCTSLTPGSGTAAPLVVPVAPTVTVQDFINYSVLTASGYTGTLLWSTGETTASITVTTAGQYCVTQYVAPCTSDPGCGTAAPIPGYTITGHVTYANTFSTPLNGVTVELKNAGGTVIGTTVTTFGPLGERGYYEFVDIVAGTYSVSSPAGGVAVPWGGNNATDALIVQLQAIGAWVPPLTGLYWIAGDVNLSSTITALDALYIKQRVVGLIGSYPAGDWTVDIITFVLTANTVKDMQALCIGDVNGSYVPATKDQSYLSPVGDMVKTIKVNEPFDYEIKSDDIANVGAMTLFLDYNPNLFEIISINTRIEGMEYRIANGTVAIAWSNTKGLDLSSDDAVFTFQMVAKETITEPTAIFTINAGSEFADNNAIRIENFDLKMGPVVTPTGDMAFSLMNYPNPFSNTTDIVYTIPENGKVKLILTNMFGQLVRTLVDVSQEAGTYSVKVDPADGYLSPGTYLYRIEVEGATETFTKTNKMVFTR